ncbi:MAG: glycosyltransferase [Desulfobacterales bacterium]|nr:glycosyltransferase [Desulfobacterales bacterium]
MGDFLLGTYLVGVSLVCFYFLSLTLANWLAFRRLTIPPKKLGSPKVSILIPARNEEHNLKALLDSLLNQDYSNYEIVVLDDNSTDGTADILREYERNYSKVRIMRGKPLPPGWLGKHFACQQLLESATGDYLLFTDADTVHAPKCVSWALTNLMHHEADFMSAFPRQKIGSFGEAIVVPGIYLVTSLFLPVWLIPRGKNPDLSFAIGQFMIGRASAFRTVGGYKKIKDSLVDDISMARMMKAAGLKTLFLDGKDFIECRMYRGYREAFSGLVKNVFAALDKKPGRLAIVFALFTAVILLPLANLIYCIVTGSDQFFLAALPVVIFFLMWFLSLMEKKLPLYVPFLYPLLFLNLMLISVVSAVRTGYGRGTLWKGRWVR